MRRKNVNFWIYLFFIKDEEAFSYLRKHYRAMVNTIICHANVSRDGHQLNRWDMLAIADTILLKCLYWFQIRRQRNFTSFYKQVLLNEFKDTYRISYRNRMPEYYQHVYLDSKVNEETRDYYVEQTYVSQDPTHEVVIGSIMVKNYLDQVLAQLNPMQKKILSLRIKGYRRIDICRQLKISPQRHDYAVRKIKKCFQEIL